MEQYTKAEFAKNSENKESPSDFTPEVREEGLAQGSIIYSKLYNTMLGELTKFSRSLSSELTNVLAEANITPSDGSVTQILNAIKQIVRNTASGVQIGDIIPNIGTEPPTGRMLCNGQWLYNCSTLFPEFFQFVINKTPYVTVSAYNSQLNTYGQCGFCAINGNDVRLPTITRPISGVSNISETGQAINATADRHVHGFGFNTRDNNGTFLFTENDINVRSKYGKSISWNGSGHTHEIVNVTQYIANMVTSEPYDSGVSEVRGKQVKYPYSVVVYSAPMEQALVDVQELINLLKYQAQLGIQQLPSFGTVNLISGAIYKGQITGSVSFVLPTPEDDSLLNQILIQLTVGSGGSVTNWGTTNYMIEEPTDEEGKYDIIYEYDALSHQWFVGQVIKVS